MARYYLAFTVVLILVFGRAYLLWNTYYETLLRSPDVEELGFTTSSMESIREPMEKEARVSGIISMILAVAINFFSFEGPPALENLAAAVIGGENITRVCVVPPWLLLAAVAFSIVIGLGSGYYPANKAVQISALEAIKSN